VATLKLSELARDAETVTTFDPFYEKQKRFRALPMAALLERAFGESAAALKERSFVLRAKDGYTVPVTGRVLLADDAYLAIDDVDVPGFEPIGTERTSPAPPYLIWKHDPEPPRAGRDRGSRRALRTHPTARRAHQQRGDAGLQPVSPSLRELSRDQPRRRTRGPRPERSAEHRGVSTRSADPRVHPGPSDLSLRQHARASRPEQHRPRSLACVPPRHGHPQARPRSLAPGTPNTWREDLRRRRARGSVLACFLDEKGAMFGLLPRNAYR